MRYHNVNYYFGQEVTSYLEALIKSEVLFSMLFIIKCSKYICYSKHRNTKYAVKSCLKYIFTKYRNLFYNQTLLS